MSGWTIIIYGAVAFGGVLLFLQLVACELEHVAQQLRKSELTARRALARQHQSESAQVIESRAA